MKSQLIKHFIKKPKYSLHLLGAVSSYLKCRTEMASSGFLGEVDPH